ncbi:MAG: capsule assembly Wzi family protein [Woeseia sp.]
MIRIRVWPALQALVCILTAAMPVDAAMLVSPGNSVLRHDLRFLDDRGIIRIPLSAWPISQADIERALKAVDDTSLSVAELAAMNRIRDKLHFERRGARVSYGLSLASNPREIRAFADTPRDESNAIVGLEWSGERVAVSLQAGYAANPVDEDEYRLDDSWAGFLLGNWIFSAGWQQRWWGPGHDGSLIMSTNARPMPALSMQRNSSVAFDNRWFGWIGPWTASVFMAGLDDERVINDALLFGFRFTFRPTENVEIGLSRSAQWCGIGRPCDGSTLLDLLAGKDNRGVNVGPEDEPGNQLAGIDMRWRLPTEQPLAVYMQWIAEDTRRGEPELGSWLRLAGLEYRGNASSWQHVSHIEIAETSCRRGGLGFSDNNPGCAYEHGIYRSGYRYRGRSIGHGVDGDGLTYSLGTTLLQSTDRSWDATIRYSEINRLGANSAMHSISATGIEQFDLFIRHNRQISSGEISLGLGWLQRIESTDQRRENDLQAFLQWQSN